MIRDMKDKHDDIAHELNKNKKRKRDMFTMDEINLQKVDEIVVSRSTNIYCFQRNSK